MAAVTGALRLRNGSVHGLLIPIALVGILAILIFPLPTAILDVCIALNIIVSLVILFTSLYIDRPLMFSSFPAILLVTTLFRLSMNVASTRLILLNGNSGMDAAGHVIQAFGQFVVGGNYIIGVVMFICINLVNLKVLTKGSSRIAEVAARFTLDAMPGKQMAIDSDLNIGLITDKEARQRRKELTQEAEFYGAMDGAAKFVAGDAVAALFLVGINVVGGLLIGIVQHGMEWKDAAQTYTILTIGEGLVAQLPSIIISAASGLIVARAASGNDLGSEVLGQLGQSARPLLLTAAVSTGLAFLPGLPFVPFMLLGSATGILGIMKQRTAAEMKRKSAGDEAQKQQEAQGPKPGSTEEVTGLLAIDTLELEVGFELVQIVEGGDLVERIRSIRRQFAIDFGFIVPPIHIRDNVRIKSTEYRFMLRGSVIGSGTLKPHHLLAMDPGNVAAPVNGQPTKEPAFGLDALWIAESDKERAQLAGYTVVDLSTVITTHITELVRGHMHELLGRQEVQHLVDNLSKIAPKVVEELIPSVMTIGSVQQVLAHLLREQVSIRDLRSILEVLADWAPSVKSPERLAEFVRRKFARSITSKFVTPDGVLPLVSLSPVLERMMNDALQQTDEGSFLALEPGNAQVIINKLGRAAEKFGELGQTPVLLAPGHLRPAVFHFVDRFAPGYAVLSHHEIAPNTKVQSLGVVSIGE
ncbi:MAG: flagellar biosynthesis protein FlhA [Pseudomonadota bacterium]|jgi:flagellar biosynthesis protein FlhA